VDTQGFDELIHPPGGDTGEVAVSNNGDQCCFGSFSAFEEPVREIGACPQLRDGNVDGADPGVSGAVAVAVALGEPVGAGFTVFGADYRVGVG